MKSIRALLAQMETQKLKQDADTVGCVLLSVSHMKDKLEQYALVEETLRDANAEVYSFAVSLITIIYLQIMSFQDIDLSTMNKSHFFNDDQMKKILKVQIAYDCFLGLWWSSVCFFSSDDSFDGS